MHEETSLYLWLPIQQWESIAFDGIGSVYNTAIYSTKNALYYMDFTRSSWLIIILYRSDVYSLMQNNTYNGIH